MIADGMLKRSLDRSGQKDRAVNTAGQMYGAFTAKWPVCTMADIKFPGPHVFMWSVSSHSVACLVGALVGVLSK